MLYHGSPESDRCPVCGDIRVDGVCPWENYSEDTLMQAMTINEADGYGFGWWDRVLIHNWRDENIASELVLANGH